MDDTCFVYDVEETRFGSAWTPLQSASAVLRARATRFGLQLLECSSVDAAASVIAADAWVMVLGASSLDDHQRFGQSAQRALAAILARAAGSISDPPVCVFDASLPPAPTSAEWLEAVEWYRAWVTAQGLDALDVFSAAASDLSCGRQEKLTSFAQLLDSLADAPSY